MNRTSTSRQATAVSRATTLAMSAAARATRGKALLLPQQIVTSPETKLQYRIDSLLGQGGFGQAYLATRVTRSRAVPAVVAMKASEHIDGWLREAYFGQILAGHSRAIRVFEAFPLTREDGSVLYCLALEHAKHGDLRSYLQRSRKGWPERTARREIAGILEVLGKLHRGQMLHRDLTPMNVFVCDGVSLKLGDFGIVRHASDRSGIDARTLNPWGAPSEIRAGAAPKWQARDDIYQVGQLLGMLVKGTAAARIRTGEVRRFRCTDHLKEIVYRCIGDRGKRYESAQELIEALTKPPATSEGRTPPVPQGDAPRVHRHPDPAPQRSRPRRPARRGDRPRLAVREDERRRARAAEPAAGRRPRRGPEAHRDQAASREGAPDHVAEREAVLAAGGAAKRLGGRRRSAVFSCGNRRGGSMLTRRRDRRPLGMALLAALSVLYSLRCTDVTITRTSEGTEAVVSGPAAPPVLIDEEGMHGPPTPTPGPYEPVFPITPPPTSTPRPV